MSNESNTVTGKKNQNDDNQDNLEKLCVVCYKNTEIYSIGECDHPVCYECSTRMRVLCEQNECPICRQSLSKVIFTNEVRSYRELETNNRSEYYNKKYKICFANLHIQKAFYDLLAHPCPKCHESFNNFTSLKDHVRKEHELFYCDICTKHLRIFSFERKCYNRQDLALHRRKGDPDNTSHRGHPLCQYCDLRYLDRDELFRHLRREHYFCHLCEADGSNQFYADYDSLCEHFRIEHYLCEEGDCANGEQFTTVFRSDIDLKAHIANVHGKSLGKQLAKQARTLQLEITLGPRNRSSNQHQELSDENAGIETFHRTINQNPPKIIDASNDQEFPSLGGPSNSATSAGVTLIHPNMSIRARAFGPANVIHSRDEFPALCSAGTNSVGSGSVGSGGGSSSSKYNNLPVSAIIKNKSQQGQQLQQLHNHHQQQGRTNSGGSGMVIHVSNRPNNNSNNQNNSNNNVNSTILNNYSNLNKKKGTAPFTSGTEKKFADDDDFPALPRSSSNNIPSNLNDVVSAKHRQLINDYVSIAQSTPNQKINIIQKDNLPNSSLSSATSSTHNQQAFVNVPELTNHNFPALRKGGLSFSTSSSSSSTTTTTKTSVPSWVKSQKLQQQENRKSKVASAPILNNHNEYDTKKSEKKDKHSKNACFDLMESEINNKKSSSKSNEKKMTSEHQSLSNNDQNKSNNNSRENKGPESSRSVNNKNCTNVNTATANKKNNNKSTNDAIDSSTKQQKQKRNNNQSIDLNSSSSFPSLSSTPQQQQQTSVVAPPPPPPGFNKIDTAKPPPPGFKSVTLNSVAKSPNSLTFTTSLGEIFSIIPNHQYIPPPNSAKRNRDLVTQFQDLLKSHDAFEEFKYISQKFREGQYKAMAYYEHCQAALKDKFDELFPELLVLLPDINKQQELYLVYCQQIKDASNKKSQKKPQCKLEVCATCKQVYKISDKQAHMKEHSLENNFPALKGISNSPHSLKHKK